VQRKEAEGKSRIEAMRRLKRHLARHYHRMLLRPPAAPDAHASIYESARSDALLDVVAADRQSATMEFRGTDGMRPIERALDAMPSTRVATDRHEERN
jgi:hypothetical protein